MCVCACTYVVLVVFWLGIIMHMHMYICTRECRVVYVPSILPAMRCMFAACFMASARLCAARPRPLMARAFDSAMLARLSNTGTTVAECMHSDASDTGRSAASLPPATTLARASKSSSNPTGDRNSRMSDAIAATPSTDGDLVTVRPWQPARQRESPCSRHLRAPVAPTRLRAPPPHPPPRAH